MFYLLLIIWKWGGVTKVLVNLLNKLDYNKYEIDILVLHYYEDMKIKLPKDVHILKGGKEFSLIDENIGKILKNRSLAKLCKKIGLVLKIHYLQKIRKHT